MKIILLAIIIYIIGVAFAFSVISILGVVIVHCIWQIKYYINKTKEIK